MDYKIDFTDDCEDSKLDILLGEVKFGNSKVLFNPEEMCETFVDGETIDDYVRTPEFFLEEITQIDISVLPKVILRDVYSLLSISSDYISVSDEMAYELDNVMCRIEQLLET